MDGSGVSGSGARGEGPGPWFDLPDDQYQRRANALSNRPDIVGPAAIFREKGWLVHDFGFAESDLAAAAAYTRAIKTNRVQDAWLVNRAIKRLAVHPRVLQFLSELYQREAFPFQTLNFPLGTQQATHSDTYHFNSRPAGFMCGVWIALEDIEPGSGPLQYFSGSQRLPIFDAAISDRPYEQVVAEGLEGAGLTSETALLRRGQALIWAANLFHGGSAITEPGRTRLSQVTHYYFDDCYYFTPLRSDAATGAIDWREPYDIARGRYMPSPVTRSRFGVRNWINKKIRRMTWRPKAD